MQYSTEVDRLIQDFRGGSEYAVGGGGMTSGEPMRKKPRAMGGEVEGGKGARRGMDGPEVDGLFRARGAGMEATRGSLGALGFPTALRPQVPSAADIAPVNHKKKGRKRPAAGAGRAGNFGSKAGNFDPGARPDQRGWESSQGSDHEDSESLPKKKRERERKRREVMNRRFSDLALALPRSSNGKADKESVLTEAIDNIRHQKNVILDLNIQNQNIKAELEALRNEKNELRNDKNYLRAELAHARDEIKQLRTESILRMDRPTMMKVLQNVSVETNAGRSQRINGVMLTPTASCPVPQHGRGSGGGIRSASMSSEAMIDALQRKSLLSTMGGDMSQLTHGVDSSKTTSHNECA